MDFIEANVLGIFFRTFFYGIYLLTMAHCLRWIFFEDEGWHLRSRINGFMLTAVVVVFLFTTTSLAVRVFLTLVAVRGSQTPPDQYIVATATMENATTLMIDAILIFRCWIVSIRSWPVIYFPLVLWLANIGFFVFYTYKTASNAMYSTILPEFFSCNIAINVYSISAIIYKILKVARKRPGGSKSELYEICRILLECGLPYLFTSIFYLVVVVIGTEFYLFPSGCALNSTMNAVAFNLLVIRVGLHRAADGRNDDDLGPTSISNLRFGNATSDQLEDYTLDHSEKSEGTQGNLNTGLQSL